MFYQLKSDHNTKGGRLATLVTLKIIIIHIYSLFIVYTLLIVLVLHSLNKPSVRSYVLYCCRVDDVAKQRRQL